MKWQEKRIPWWAIGAGVLALLIIAWMYIQRQNSDLAMLERTYENLNAKRILLQYEQSELQRELNVSGTADYIAARARENGYMMPNELHFVVDNPEVLTDHETLDQVQLTTVQPVLPQPAQNEEAAAPAEAAETAAGLPAEETEPAPVSEENEP